RVTRRRRVGGAGPHKPRGDVVASDSRGDEVERAIVEPGCCVGDAGDSDCGETPPDSGQVEGDRWHALTQESVGVEQAPGWRDLLEPAGAQPGAVQHPERAAPVL